MKRKRASEGRGEMKGRIVAVRLEQLSWRWSRVVFELRKVWTRWTGLTTMLASLP